MDGSVAFRLTAHLCRTEFGFFFVLKVFIKRLIQVHRDQYLRVLTRVLLVVLLILTMTH